MRAGVAVILVSLAVAGCIGGTTDRTNWTDTEVITDPTDRSYDATSGYHIHDYWQGEDVVTVVNGTSYPTYTGVEASNDTYGPHRFRPPDGAVVPQGTAKLSVTVTWEETEPVPLHGGLEFWMKPANASEPRLVEGNLTSGETFEVPLAYEEADLPHRLVSAWEFHIHIKESSRTVDRFSGRLHLDVQAHRGLELKPFPPHPDHWGNRTELALVEETRTFRQINHAFEYVSSQDRYTWDGDQHIRPSNGTIVPWGTERVTVELSWDREIPVGGLDLYYHAADTLNLTLLEPEEVGESSARYDIVVRDAMADTPYADSSLWEFVVSAPEAYRGEVHAFRGEFTLDATAHKA